MSTSPAILRTALLGLTLLTGAQAQQVPDLDADVTVTAPAFERGAGPVVAIDGGHLNFHTLENRFAPFAALLHQDGFRVSAVQADFSAESLRNIDILVIANALNTLNRERWATPVHGAFTSDEIKAVARWVADGGSLLLLADHFPFAGAAAGLAAAFGIGFINGFALAVPIAGSDIFSSRSGTLRDDTITRGRNEEENVTAVTTFTGSAFKAPPGARPLLVLPENFVLLLPAVAWQFDEDTPRLSGAGYLQGAAMRYGKGRVAVFAEAGMFTAQRTKSEPTVRIGFNATEAPQNKQFILSTLRWLAGILQE